MDTRNGEQYNSKDHTLSLHTQIIRYPDEVTVLVMKMKLIIVTNFKEEVLSRVVRIILNCTIVH